MAFQRATSPLLEVAGAVRDSHLGEELSRHVRDVADHAAIAAEPASGFRLVIANVLLVVRLSVCPRADARLARRAWHKKSPRKGRNNPSLGLEAPCETRTPCSTWRNPCRSVSGLLPDSPPR